LKKRRNFKDAPLLIGKHEATMNYYALMDEWEKSVPYTQPHPDGLRTYSMADLLSVPEPNPRQHGMRWGPWRYDAKTLELKYSKDGYTYEVDLERCNSSAQILDWVCQVSQKSWCSVADLGHLVNALDALLDPQEHVCSGAMGGGRSTGRYRAAKTILRKV